MHLNLCIWIVPKSELKAYNFIKLLAYTDLNIYSPLFFKPVFRRCLLIIVFDNLTPSKKKSHWKRNVLILMHPIVYYVKENNEKYHGTFPLRKCHWVFYCRLCRLQMQPSYRGVHKSTDKVCGPGPWYSYPDSEGTIASMYVQCKKREKLAQSCFEFNFQRPIMSKHYWCRPNGCWSQKIGESLENSKTDIWWSTIPQTLSKIKNH